MTLLAISNVSDLSIILFVVGIVLLVVEMTIPGFGLVGITGIALLILDIFITAKTFVDGLILTAFVFLVLAGLLIVFLILASHGKLPRKIVLKSQNNVDEGFTSANHRGNLLHHKGISASDLRPAGIATIDRQRCDVVTRGEFIGGNTSVEVIAIEGNRIIVREIKEE